MLRSKHEAILFAFLTTLGVLATGCAPLPEEDPAPDSEETATATSALSPVTLRVAVIPFYYNSNVPSMNNPVAKPLAWGAPANGWDLVGVFFTALGTDASTGSAKGYWSQVSTGNITLTGRIFPWTEVRNAGTADAPQNRRPLYLWFDGSRPLYSAYFSDGKCTGDWELDANNNALEDVPAVDLDAQGKCLCRDVPSVSPHYVEVACGGNCPEGSPDLAPRDASDFYFAGTGATWCRIALEGGANQITAIQGSIPSVGVITRTHTGAAEVAAFNAADYDVVVYGYPEAYGGQHGGATIWASVATRTYAFTTAAHELGHNLGLAHSANRVCASGGINLDTDPVSAIGTPLTLDAEANCYAWLDHGDCCSGYGAYSIMGDADYANHINGYQKLAAGALDPSALSTLTSTGTYTVQKSTSTWGTRLLRISTDPSRGPAYHYLEYRTAAANTFDSNLPSGMQGITVTMAPDYSISSYPELLDAHPVTFGNFNDAAMKLGESFTDPGRGFVSQVASVGASSASIDVSFRPTNTNLFTYQASNGELRVYWQDSAGLRTLKHTVPNAWTQWTHVAGCNGRGLLFYSAGGGAAWGAYVSTTGTFVSAGSLTLPAGFTHVTCAGKGNLFLYNSATGAYQTGTITSSGVFTPGASDTTLAGYTVVAGTTSGKVVFYGRNVIWPTQRAYAVAALDSTGQLSSLQTGTMGTNYTIIAPVRENGLLFYKGSTGALHRAKIDDQGRITWVNTNFYVGAGYTDIAGGQNGSVTLYNASQAFFDTTTVGATFNMSPVASGTAAHGMKLTGVGGI